MTDFILLRNREYTPFVCSFLVGNSFQSCWIFLWMLRLAPQPSLFSQPLIIFIWSRGCEYRTCCDFQMSNSRLYLAHWAPILANFLFDISTWLSNGSLKLNQAKQYSWWPSHPHIPIPVFFCLSSSSSQSMAPPSTWLLKPKISSLIPCFLLPNIQFTIMSYWFYFQNISQIYLSIFTVTVVQASILFLRLVQ